MNGILNKLFGIFIGRTFARVGKNFARERRFFEPAKAALANGDETSMAREWARVAGQEAGLDMVRDNTLLRVARAWGKHLMKEKRWPEAQLVWTRALDAPKGVVTQRIEALFALAETLYFQDRVEEVQTLLNEHPLTKQIEAISGAWPGSDSGATLAQLRFDYSREAVLRAKFFISSPLLPGEAGEQLRETTGDQNARYRRIAMAHFHAGEISLAVRAQQIALTSSRNPVHQVGGRCLLALWRRVGKGWAAVEPLLKEAENLADGNVAAESFVLLIRRIAALERADWPEWTRIQEQLRSRDLSDQNTENSEVDAAVLRGDFTLAREALERMRLAPLAVEALDAFRARSFPPLTGVFLELRAYYCGEECDLSLVEAQLREVQKRLRGDRRLLAMTYPTQGLTLAILGRRDEALAVVQGAEKAWDEWRDDVSTQIGIAGYTGSTCMQLGNPQEAIAWFERNQSLETRPAYFFSLRELLARAYFQAGNSERARQLWREVVESGLEIKAVELAQRALDS